MPKAYYYFDGFIHSYNLRKNNLRLSKTYKELYAIYAQAWRLYIEEARSPDAVLPLTQLLSSIKDPGFQTAVDELKKNDWFELTLASNTANFSLLG